MCTAISPNAGIEAGIKLGQTFQFENPPPPPPHPAPNALGVLSAQTSFAKVFSMGATPNTSLVFLLAPSESSSLCLLQLGDRWC